MTRFTKSQIPKLLSAAEDVTQAIDELTDAAASYEDAENTEDRTDARQAMFDALRDLRAAADTLCEWEAVIDE